MLPFGNESITLYNRLETKDANGRTVVSWKRAALTGCFWSNRLSRVPGENGVILAQTNVCKIPESANYRAPGDWTGATGTFSLSTGDVIVRGTVTDTISGTLTAAALVEKYKRGGAFIVTSARNNVRPGVPLGHYVGEDKRVQIKLEVEEVNININALLRKVRSDPFWTFAAAEWHRLYTPYVPLRTGTLSQQVNITPGQIEHTAPYAHYQYTGEVYGPNIPIYEDGVQVGFYSPPGKPKSPTGRALSYKTDLHPLASKEWDKAAEPTQKPKLISAMQAYIDSGRLNLDG